MLRIRDWNKVLIHSESSTRFSTVCSQMFAWLYGPEMDLLNAKILTIYVKCLEHSTEWISVLYKSKVLLLLWLHICNKLNLFDQLAAVSSEFYLLRLLTSSGYLICICLVVQTCLVAKWYWQLRCFTHNKFQSKSEATFKYMHNFTNILYSGQRC